MILPEDTTGEVVAHRLVLPERGQAAGFQLEQRTAAAVAGGNENLVTDDNRRGGVDVILCFPGEPGDYLAAIQFMHDQAESVEHREAGVALECEQGRGAVSDRVVAVFPDDSAGEFVECHERALRRADIQQNPPVQHERRAGKSPGWHFAAEIGHELLLPEDFTGVGLQAEQVADLAQGIDPVAIHGGRGESAAVPILWGERAGVGMFPADGAGGGVKANDRIGFSSITEGVSAALADGDGRTAQTDVGFPKLLGAGRRPLG